MTLTKHFSLSTKHFKAKHGFTLIELLIVMSIIAILVASATASWRNAQMKGRDGKRKADLKSVQQALENYYQVKGVYPQSRDDTSNVGTITCLFTWRYWGQVFDCEGQTYMQQLPKDPVFQSVNLQGYDYYSVSPYQSYTISARIENTNDPELVGLPCTPRSSPNHNYCVKNP